MAETGAGHRPGIGHNSETGGGWRRYAWKRARADLMKNKVPLQIVRIRVRRAAELGLSYPQYASILMGSGRDITAFLFTVGGLELRLRRELGLEARIREKLATICGTRLAVLGPAEEDAEAFRSELQSAAGVVFCAAGNAPEPGADWSRGRAAVTGVLRELRLPGAAVVMIGADGGPDPGLAVAGRLGGFLPGRLYFPGAA